MRGPVFAILALLCRRRAASDVRSCAIAVIGGAAGLFNACFESSLSPAAPPPSG
jgi:hypothetical protein